MDWGWNDEAMFEVWIRLERTWLGRCLPRSILSFLIDDPSGSTRETDSRKPSASAASSDAAGQLTAADFPGSSNFGFRALSGDDDIVIE